MPNCETCGTDEHVHATLLGYLCVLCLSHWPYVDVGEVVS